MYRFSPDLSDFEVVTNTSNNTWGLGFTEDNDIFASTANNTHSVFVGIPNADLDGVKGIPLKGSEKIDGHYAMHPITSHVRQVDVFGGFTAASGHHFYTARDYPSSYWDQVAFVCEPTGHLVHMAKIAKEGAGYTESDGWNLFASADEWVSPVAARVGPDGAVWVLDWYNFIVQHNPTPTEDRGGYNAETGEGNAYVNPLRDKSRGRVWRVVWKGAKEYEPIALSKDNPDALIRALSNDNMFWRMTAQRLLVERNNNDILNELYDLVDEKEVDSLGLNVGALHALWTIQGLGAIGSDEKATKIVRGALEHPSYAVRKGAVAMLPNTESGVDALLKADLLHDKNPTVQLAALLYFTESNSSQQVGEALYELSKEQSIVNDPWLSKAVYIASSKHDYGFITAYKAENPSPRSTYKKTDANAQNNLFQDASIAEVFAANYKGERPAEEGRSETSITTAKETTIIRIKTVQNEMKYDISEFVVKAGQPVEIIFENPDFMQHNLVITKPGAKEKVGLAADKLASDPNGEALNYVPDMEEILFSSPLLDPEKTVSIKFTAPKNPDIYPFICTFPGHWRLMQGQMKVIK